MTIPLSVYAKTKNHYCLGYFGTDQNVIYDLLNARSIIGQTFPGISLYIVIPDAWIDLTTKHENIYPYSFLPRLVSEVSYYKELTTTVADFLAESGILDN